MKFRHGRIELDKDRLNHDIETMCTSIMGLSAKEFSTWFADEDILYYTRVLRQQTDIVYYKKKSILHIFDNAHKFKCLLYLMEEHWKQNLVSKSDLANTMRQISKEGAMKFVNHCVDTRVFFEYKNSKKDKRKVFILPSVQLIEEYDAYMKERFALGFQSLLPVLKAIYARTTKPTNRN